MNGNEQAAQLQQAGFSTDEIAQWASGERQRLTAAGFSDGEVNEYFGQKDLQLDPVRKAVQTGMDESGVRRALTRVGASADLQNRVVGDLAAGRDPLPGATGDEIETVRRAARLLETNPDPRAAKDFQEALAAGLQMSVDGLIQRGKTPDLYVPKDAPMAQRIASQIGTTAGDLKYMVGGFVLGGGAGAETGPGAAVTGMAGAFGLPAGLRAVLMDAYSNGEVTGWRDFWQRASGAVWETVKGEITGAATAVGGIGTRAVLPAATPMALRVAAPTAAEIGTMTTVGSALEGHVPDAQDFMDAAVVLGGLKVAGSTAARLRRVYADTGIRPQDVVDLHAKDPTVLPALMDDARAIRDAKVPAASSGELPAPPEASDAQKAILDRVSVGEPEKRTYSWTKLYADTKDDLYPIRALVDELKGDATLSASKDPYILARLSRGAAGKAEQFIENSPFEFDTHENVGKPLREIVAPVKDDLDGLRAYVVAKRALELDARGIESGIPKDEARAVVTAGGKYEPVRRELLQYQDHLVNYLVDAGVLSKDSAVKMREANRNYVPFYRLADEKPGAGADEGVSVRSPIKYIEGGKRQLIDPLESVIRNTYQYTRIAEQAHVARSLIETWEAAGKPDMIKKVEPPAKAIEVQQRELQRFLAQHGIDASEAEALTIFRREYLNPAENQIAILRNGERELYEVPPEVAAAMKALDRESANILVKILSVPAKTLRAGATLAPEFMGRNIVRDQLSAAIFSDNGFKPVLDLVQGAVSIWKKDAVYQAWLKSGGANAAMVSLDRAYLQMKLDEITGPKGIAKRAWNIVKTPVEMLRIASELAENATRLGEFKKGLDGDTSKQGAQAAAYGSREVTLDFARIGTQTRAMNVMTAFWNAQVEGADRTVRAFKDHPFRTTARVATYITLPSVLLWMANHEDPRWKEIPSWQKDIFWIVFTEDHIYRIPKPFELGLVFGSLPERLLDQFAADRPDAFKGFAKSFANTFGLNMMPTAAAPIVEQMTNHSFFTDRPLVPHHLEGILPEYQYSPYTSEATKALGQIIGALPGMQRSTVASPIVLDNYVRGWSGTLGTYAVQIADAALRKAGALPDPVKPAATLADIPAVRAFVVRYPSAQAQSIQDFNEHYRDAKQITDTIQALAQRGDAQAALKVMKMDPMEMIRLDGIHQALNNAQRVVMLVQGNPSLSAEEKRQLIDNTYAQMIQMARAGEDGLRRVKAATAEHKATAAAH